MEVEIFVNKSVEENAGLYFDAAKKAKKKLKGAEKTIVDAEKKLKETIKKHEELERNKVKLKIKRKLEWYEKFRWFYTEEDFLVIGGKDATTNEIVIKKHTDKDDVVFHTDMAGSPFFVIKSNGKEVSEQTMQDVTNATFVYSRAYKLGLSTANVFHVKPEQVSKQAEAGTSLPKGAFMIYGKTTYRHPKADVGIGLLEDGRIMGAPLNCIKKHCKDYVVLEKGNEKTEKLAKQIRKIIKGELDEIVKAIPPGGCKIKKS
jgi:predicted ribosome quality control (RQC) complex YloA/Tae2 family protein